MKNNSLLFIALFLLLPLVTTGQCDLIFKYDEAGNRIFRGNECDPDCSTHVVSTDDNGSGTLREAIFCAQDGDYITFDNTLDGQTINLESESILVDKSVHINEDHMAYTTVDVEVMSMGDHIVMEIAQDKTVSIEGLDMTSHEGYDDNPRVLLNNGTLSLNELILTDDRAFIGTNSTLLNNGVLNILETVKLIYVNYQ